MSNHYGTGNLFGLADVTSISLASLCNLTHVQSLEVTPESDEELIKDGRGVTKIINKYDMRSKATFEFVMVSGTNTGTLSVAAGTYPTVGATVTIANSVFEPIAGVWVVDGLNFSRGNTRSMLARINLSKYTEGAVP